MLPIERARQLKSIADARSFTVTEVIEGVINAAIEAGEIPDETPGFQIEALPPRKRVGIVRFEVDGIGFPGVRSSDARAIADAFDRVAGGHKGVACGPHLGRTLKIARVGRGVVMVGEDEFGTPVLHRSCTVGTCRDLARQLRKAADRAEHVA